MLSFCLKQTNEPIPGKRFRWIDSETLIYRTLLATASCPISEQVKFSGIDVDNKSENLIRISWTYFIILQIQLIYKVTQI